MTATIAFNPPEPTLQGWLFVFLICFAASMMWWEVRLAFYLRLIDLCEWGMRLFKPFVDKRDELQRRLKELEDGKKH